MQLEAADLNAADDSAKLAILECMLLAVFADGKVTADEIQKFDQIAESVPWGMDKPILVALIKGAQERMKTMNTPQAITDFVANISTRVTSPVLREKIVYTMALIAATDGVMHQFEKNLLGLMIISFNLTTDKVKEIKAAVEAASPPKRA